MTDIFVEGTARIIWEYPNISAERGPLDVLTINLWHVRALNCLRIEFDGARNGFVLRMDRTRDLGNEVEIVEEQVEVAFIPAWLETGDPVPTSATRA